MYGKDPPKCEECMPLVLEGNKEAYEIFLIVRNQHIMSFNGPVDLNVQSLIEVMNLLGVEDKKRVFRMAYLAYRIGLKKMMEKAEEERVEAKSKR